MSKPKITLLTERVEYDDIPKPILEAANRKPREMKKPSSDIDSITIVKMEFPEEGCSYEIRVMYVHIDYLNGDLEPRAKTFLTNDFGETIKSKYIDI